jgi:hypothetical protein
MRHEGAVRTKVVTVPLVVCRLAFVWPRPSKPEL